MTDLRLLVFDVDGTLIDSQAFILEAMRQGFAAVGRAEPARGDVLKIVGLSLPEAARALAPGSSREEMMAIVEAYRRSFIELREQSGGEATSPLYPGAREAILRLGAREELLLGVATGKARRGLDHALKAHDLEGRFATLQTSDNHPSKPHPAMLHSAIDAVGLSPERTVMLGDTTYDIEMAVAAGAAPLGVSWGYHAPEALLAAGAVAVIDHFDDLDAALETIWR